MCRPRAKPHVGAVVEFDGLRGDPLGEQDPEELHGREHVPTRVVRVVERDAVPLADRLEPVAPLARLEQPERVERARDASGAVADPGARERVLEEREIEIRVVRDEDGAVEQRQQLPRELGEARRNGDGSVVDPVHGGRLRGDRPRRAHEAREAVELETVGGEPHHGEGDDLVRLHARPGRLEIDHGVRSGRRHLAPQAHGARQPRERGDDAKCPVRASHGTSMSAASDGDPSRNPPHAGRSPRAGAALTQRAREARTC